MKDVDVVKDVPEPRSDMLASNEEMETNENNEARDASPQVEDDDELNELKGLIELTQTRNLVKNTLSLKELSMIAVCKYGFFSQYKDDKEKRDAYRASIPKELVKEMKQYRRYWV